MNIGKAFDRVLKKDDEVGNEEEGYAEVQVIAKVVMSLNQATKTKVEVGSELSKEFLCIWASKNLCFLCWFSRM